MFCCTVSLSVDPCTARGPIWFVVWMQFNIICVLRIWRRRRWWGRWWRRRWRWFFRCSQLWCCDCIAISHIGIGNINWNSRLRRRRQRRRRRSRRRRRNVLRRAHSTTHNPIFRSKLACSINVWILCNIFHLFIISSLVYSSWQICYTSTIYYLRIYNDICVYVFV